MAPALKSWAVVKLLLICKFNQQHKLKIWLKVNTSQLYNQHIQFNHSSKNRAQMSIAFVLHLDDAHCFLFCSQWCLLFFVFQPMISLFFVLHCMVCYILLSAYDLYCFLFYTLWYLLFFCFTPYDVLYFVISLWYRLFFVLHPMMCYILLSAYDIYCFLFYTLWCVIFCYQPMISIVFCFTSNDVLYFGYQPIISIGFSFAAYDGPVGTGEIHGGRPSGFHQQCQGLPHWLPNTGRVCTKRPGVPWANVSCVISHTVQISTCRVTLPKILVRNRKARKKIA